MRLIIHKAKNKPRRVLFPEGEHEKILRAAHILVEEKIAQPMLIGNTEVIRAKAADLSIPLEKIQIVDPAIWPKRESYIQTLYELRQRRGVTLSEARELIHNRNLFGAVMVQVGDADALVGGVMQHFPDTIRPALQVIKPRPGLHKVSGLYALVTQARRHVFPGGLHGEYRAERRRPGGDRVVRGGNSEAVQRDAASGDAVVFQLWQHAAPADG